MVPLHDLLSKCQLVLKLQDLRMVAILYAGIVALVSVLIPIPLDGLEIQALLLVRCRGVICRVGVLIIFVKLGLKIDLFLQVVVYEPTD